MVTSFVTFIFYYTFEKSSKPTSLTSNVTILNNILTDINFIKSIVGLKVYIV
jgi:hypothetical protein